MGKVLDAETQGPEAPAPTRKPNMAIPPARQPWGKEVDAQGVGDQSV